MNKIVLLVLVNSLVFLGCAGRGYLIVDYQMPPASDQLKGQVVQLFVKDTRQDKSLFTQTAAADFQDFQNRYSLAWIGENQDRIMAGEHELIDLFRLVFQKRLERQGVTITNDPRAKVPVFEVDIKQLKIDLKDRKWITQVGYEANLSRDSSLIARENISGEAERLKVIGRKGADTVFSDIFTEIVNRVDIQKLFKQAGLTL